MKTKLSDSPATRLLTPKQIYQRKQRAWRAYVEWRERIIRAFFPDTGGNGLLMHNWYRCAAATNPVGAKLADWIDDSTHTRIHRIHDKLDAQYDRNEHILNHGPHFRPLWCKVCQSH